ncbi:acyl-CoA dehydrogenase [Pseudomaricurvus alkylphenolicus]|uniref:acyl-CoA dehydrogenase family protein n=1 Tax=Pseudomaricurvus alkylphenolicus TaxID=1306991 RepID=UPI0014247ECB|nr:acyl-CoA dehydrogenase family protein [Pseudomaricurvus alkylphenolicus]NIB41030.1 acyl-CoA dehydrogenase [Pseudomaricurvus alkylphenolicus]
MQFEFTPEQQALREELREYFRQLITPEIRQAVRGNEGEGEGGEVFRKVVRQMGVDGKLALGWPKQYGGQGLGAVEQLIFFEELRLADAPIPFVTLNTVGPALMEHGSEEHKAKYLPKIAAGEIHFAIGYSEPGAGTDLASLSTSAERDGDDYVINGTKVFTSGAGGADYIWLAVRTDPQAPKHKGISIFIVPTNSPGFSHSPIHTVGEVTTNMTYYENVRVPASALVGELNKGWQLITSQLNHERVGLAAFNVYGLGLYDRVHAWASKAPGLSDTNMLIDEPWVQTALAESYGRLEAMRLINLRMAWDLEQNRMSPALASGAKVYSTECLIEVYRKLMDIVGSSALLPHDVIGTELLGDLEEEYRKCQITTFGGGVNEVQRDLVAAFGLGMPMAAR